MNKNLKEYIRYNEAALKNSSKDFKSIFEIMFRKSDNVLCESNDGFRIKKQTYGEIRNMINTAAGALYKKIGASGSYVALELDNSAEWIIAFWAILMSGNKPYLVNMRYPASLSNSILKTLNIRYTVCDKKSGLDTEAIDVSSLLNNADACPDDIFQNEIAFSSSATSMNEVVCFYSGEQVAEEILNFKSIIKQGPRITKHYKGSLKQLAFLPFYHVFGLFAVYFWFTFFGRTLVFLRDYSADTILKTCRRHEVTHIFAVPMLWHTIEKQVLSAVKEKGEKKQKKFTTGLKLMTKLQNVCPSLGAEVAKRMMSEVTDQLFGKSVMFCISGGSYLRESAIQMMNGIGYCLHNGYGMSEVGITSVELRKKPKYRNLNSIGKPFDSVEYKIDENGILHIKGSSLCRQKLINGEMTAIDGWFDTGDKMCEKDGHYYIMGRQGDVVIGENGENINPDTVEQNFNIADAISLCVLGLKEDNGEELSIVVQINPYLTGKQLDTIRNEIYSVNDTLPKTTAIKRFYFTYDALCPPTAIKVGRKQLIKKIESGEVKLTAFSDMTAASHQDDVDSALMIKIKEIIASKLGIDKADIASDGHIFFDLGATSIQYFSILTALSEEFSIESYDDTEKYRYTPREICEYIERHL